MGIPRGVLESEFLDETGFAGTRATAMNVGTDHVHFDFTGGIAAEDGAILEEDDLGAVACGGDGGADAGQASANHDEIGVKLVTGHLMSKGLDFETDETRERFVVT